MIAYATLCLVWVVEVPLYIVLVKDPARLTFGIDIHCHAGRFGRREQCTRTTPSGTSSCDVSSPSR